MLFQATFYKTNNVLFTMGGDFNWENAHEYFKNLDKLIKYVNEKVCYITKLNTNKNYVNLFIAHNISQSIFTQDL